MSVTMLFPRKISLSTICFVVSDIPGMGRMGSRVFPCWRYSLRYLSCSWAFQLKGSRRGMVPGHQVLTPPQTAGAGDISSRVGFQCSGELHRRLPPGFSGLRAVAMAQLRCSHRAAKSGRCRSWPSIRACRQLGCCHTPGDCPKSGPWSLPHAADACSAPAGTSLTGCTTQ